MTTLTIRLPDDTSLRLKQLAASRGMSLNKLFEELSTAVLASYDAETRFRTLAAGADRNAALDILARLDELDRSRTP
jgi:predicted transcriptional regulator